MTTAAYPQESQAIEDAEKALVKATSADEYNAALAAAIREREAAEAKYRESPATIWYRIVRLLTLH